MEQKEVLIVIGVLVVGFVLFRNNALSGQATFSEDTVSYPQGSEATDAYESSEPPSGLSTSNTIPCPGRNWEREDVCEHWEISWFKCGRENVPCHCGTYDDCKKVAGTPAGADPRLLLTSAMNAIKNMGEPNCAGDCTKTVLYSVNFWNNMLYKPPRKCVTVTRTITCTEPNRED